MCGAPERRYPTVITIMDHKLQLLKPLNKRELYAT
jgi:hypothetical protein